MLELWLGLGLWIVIGLTLVCVNYVLIPTHTLYVGLSLSDIMSHIKLIFTTKHLQR